MNSTSFDSEKKIGWKKLYEIQKKNFELFQNKNFIKTFSKFDKSKNFEFFHKKNFLEIFSKFKKSKNFLNRSFRRMACKKIESRMAFNKINFDFGKKKYLKFKKILNFSFLKENEKNKGGTYENYEREKYKGGTYEIFKRKKSFDIFFDLRKKKIFLEENSKKNFGKFLDKRKNYFEKNFGIIKKIKKILKTRKMNFIYKRSFSDFKIKKKISYFPK